MWFMTIFISHIAVYGIIYYLCAEVYIPKEN